MACVRRAPPVTDLAVVAVAFAVVVVVVVGCATFRPHTADAVATSLRALAAVFAAAWPWKR